MDLYIANSKIGGKGTFTKNLIKNGSFIKTLSGEKINLNETIKRIDDGIEGYDDPLQIDEYQFIDLDEPSRLINHSCDPNAGLRGENDLFAIRDIKPEEEITFDYSTTVSKDLPFEVWHMNCNCGSKNCRKVIGNVLSIQKNQLEKYKKTGALQDYIWKQLKPGLSLKNSSK